MRTSEEANPSAPCIYLHSQVYIHHLIPKLQENKKKKNSSSSKLSVSFFMERPSKAQYFRICFCFRRMFRLKAAEPPHDVKALFETYSENGTMSVDHLLWFLSEFQGEEKATKEDAQAILNSLKHLNIFQRKGLHLEAFFKHLFSDNNPPLSPLGVHHDMTAPLAHYFLYTGHNSYLTGNQLSSDCSDEPIIKALKRGVRVIELDLWPNSTRDGVDVRHGGTLTTPVELGKCLRAIKDNAFIASEYPVIITFEDHLTPALQAKVANMVIETFGSTLFRPESELKELPSPESLKSKILISTKPPKEYLEAHMKQKGNPHKAKGSAVDDESEVDDEDHESDEEEDVQAEYRSLIAIHAGKVKGGMHNWFSDDPDKVRRISLSEQELENAVKTCATDIVRFTQRNLLRVYPKGIRFDSSNYNPFVGWAHGAQMVAYNMQGYGKNLWIMHGMFRANGGCGYVKKPDFLLDRYENFDPEEDELPVKTTLKVKIYFGEGWQSDFSRTYFDLYSPPDFYTKVGIAGVRSDTKMHRTKAIEDQWVPVWNEEFEFPLTVPELAVLRIEVLEYDTSGKPDFGGQTCLPISELRSGIRAVPLHDRRGDKYKSVKLLMQFKFV